jgi:hypothetical protein
MHVSLKVVIPHGMKFSCSKSKLHAVFLGLNYLQVSLCLSELPSTEFLCALFSLETCAHTFKFGLTEPNHSA